MKVGDIVRTPRYGTYYLIMEKHESLSSSHGGQVFTIMSIDLAHEQVLNERLLEAVNEIR